MLQEVKRKLFGLSWFEGKQKWGQVYRWSMMALVVIVYKRGTVLEMGVKTHKTVFHILDKVLSWP